MRVRASVTVVVAGIFIAGVGLLTPASVHGQAPAAGTNAPVPFAKDVAPILQRSCQSCHRPGQMAPMSLMTYQEVRPWVRAIKQRVTERSMPPWGIDPHVGIQRLCIELIYPDNKTELINCANWSFNWHIVSVYDDDVAPIYPAGTVLHVISWHDNSANKDNPDPRNWVGSGQRTIDEMGFAWITWHDYTDEEYKAAFDARKAVKRTTTSAAAQPQSKQ